MYKAQPGQNIECCLQYLSTKSCIHSSTFPSRKRERNATLFFPCSLAKVASFCIPSTSPSAECSSSKPLRSTACLRHSSATSNCASQRKNSVRRPYKIQVQEMDNESIGKFKQVCIYINLYSHSVTPTLTRFRFFFMAFMAWIFTQILYEHLANYLCSYLHFITQILQ